MISQTAEYALQAVVTLAHHPGKSLTTHRIAELIKLRPAYLSKVLHVLGRSGLVRAQRGVNGGFLLARPPREISVLDVIAAVDPIKRVRACPLHLNSHSVGLCPLHHSLDEAASRLEGYFAGLSIEDMLDPHSACGSPDSVHADEGVPAADHNTSSATIRRRDPSPIPVTAGRRGGMPSASR